MKTTVLLISLICFSASWAFSQYYTNENKIWAYGNYAGLDFTSGVPVPFRGFMSTNEGCASVCDPAGHLLFYTDGKIVYRPGGGYMNSTLPLVSWSTYSTTQAAVIVPVMSTTSQYYIFSLETEGVLGACRLAYSIVDMHLDGGLGDVVPSAIGIPIDSGMSEKMIPIPGSRCNIWLLTHRASTRQFYAYSITPSGISAPVVSTFSTPAIYHSGIGQMICSPDTRTIVMQNNLSAPAGTELYSFDTATGMVSNRVVLDSLNMHYGAEFSPDNSKLYSVSYNNTGNSVIEQYDLSLSSTAAIVASRDTIVIGTYSLTTQMRLGPDGKIYLNNFIGDSSNYLDVINVPNMRGPACGYIWHQIMLSPGTYGELGMPSLFVSKELNFVSRQQMDTTICRSEKIYPIGIAPAYLWYDGSTYDSDTVSVSGTYWVIEENGCDATMDSLHVTVKPSPQRINGPDSICLNNYTNLYSLPGGGVWSSSSPSVASVGSSDGFVTALSQGRSIISYTLSSGCAETKNMKILPPCIDEVKEEAVIDNDVTLYPNPASDVCTFSFSGTPSPVAQVYLFNITGRLVGTYPLNSTQTTVSITNLPAGVYQCRIKVNEQIVINRKLVIVR